MNVTFSVTVNDDFSVFVSENGDGFGKLSFLKGSEDMDIAPTTYILIRTIFF